jgi:hypothetical protein
MKVSPYAGKSAEALILARMMKITDFMKSNSNLRLTVIAVVAAGCCLGSCTNNSPLVPEAEYSTKIVGRWQGTVGDLKEAMSIDSDGTFVCQLQQTGFIANTLSQGVAGTIRGTWKITGAIITLRITGSENEHLMNRVTSTTIVAFKEDELVLKSDRDETSPFQRVRALNKKPK